MYRGHNIEQKKIERSLNKTIKKKIKKIVESFITILEISDEKLIIKENPFYNAIRRHMTDFITQLPAVTEAIQQLEAYIR